LAPVAAPIIVLFSLLKWVHTSYTEAVAARSAYLGTSTLSVSHFYRALS